VLQPTGCAVDFLLGKKILISSVCGQSNHCGQLQHSRTKGSDMSNQASQAIQKIGFLGVGAIGRPIAERILKNMPIMVCDSDREALAMFESRAETTSSAVALGDNVDIVFACLPSLSAHEKALLDEQNGVVAGRRIGGFVQVGTTGPVLARSIAASFGKRGIRMIDAPVTGGVPRAKEGTLTVIASGDRSLFLECEPVIRSFASNIVFVGQRAGSAQTAKLINNLLSATNLAIGCEALVLGAKAGLDPRSMLEVLNTGTGQNSATLIKIPNHVISRGFDYGARMELICKDLKALVAEAGELGAPAPIAVLIEEIYRKAAESGLENADMTTIIQPMEQAAGVRIGKMP
jgi:3-hydroxyisobutyrate dehydrogenase-like beta-hydroxyacid dehydrogenase